VTLDWILLLGTDNVGACLEKLYKDMSIEELAHYLGVSTTALQRQLRIQGVKRRSPGGPHRYKLRPEHYPEGLENMATAQIVDLTGWSPNYAREVRRRVRHEKGWEETKGS